MTGSDAPLVDVGRFDRIEATGSANDFAAWMEQQRLGGPDLLIDRLDIGLGDRVLDVGCGPGVDLADIARRGASAVGLDLSATMAAMATDRARGEGGMAVVGDGLALPLRTASFDACLCRAVLLHSPNPAEMVSEVARTLRAGGLAVFSEPDHGSHIVATTEIDVFERLLAHRRTTFRNPLVGRHLPDLVTAAGMVVQRSWAFPIVHRSLHSARRAGGPFGVAVQAAVDDEAITAGEAERYLDSLEELDRRGAFFFVAMSIAVIAVGPAADWSP